MITREEFERALETYKKEEKRAKFYDMVVNLFDKGFKVEGCVIILAIWNSKNFGSNLKSFDSSSFESTLTSLEKSFAPLDGIEFRTADFDKLSGDISTIYETLSTIEYVKFTGASKLMHLRNRKLFVIWDGYIRGSNQEPKKHYENLDIVKRGDWKLKEYGNSADDYIEFLKDMQKRFTHINFIESGKTFAKAIDEFNYANITLQIQKMGKNSKKEKNTGLDFGNIDNYV